LYRIAAPPGTLYKGRLSLILLFTGDHYELLEVKRGNNFESMLPPDDSLIQQLRTENERE
jgi:hypothetical protein